MAVKTMTASQTVPRTEGENTVRDSTVALLRRNPLFAALDERGLARLLAGSLTQLLPRGAVLFDEGAGTDAVHVLLSGRVALTATAENGQRTVIESFGAGEVVVTPAVILDLPYMVGGQVTQNARILFLQSGIFRREIDQQPALARALVDMLARHWRVLVELMKELKLHDGRTRLARWLATQAAEGGGGPLQLSEAKSVLARRLGMTPESLSRNLAAFESRGLIAINGASISVLDAAALARSGV